MLKLSDGDAELLAAVDFSDRHPHQLGGLTVTTAGACLINPQRRHICVHKRSEFVRAGQIEWLRYLLLVHRTSRAIIEGLA